VEAGQITPREAVQRRRLRLAAIVVVLFLAAGIRYEIASSPPVYAESASVVFSLPKSVNSANAYIIFVSSLISSGQAMSQILMSPQAQRRISEAGGKADVSLALVNLYDEEYPNYGLPLATLTTSSTVAANVHETFVIAARELGQLLTGWQARVGVRPRNRISAEIIGDTGPVVQAGSSKRVSAGLVVLALAGISTLWGFIDRRRARHRFHRRFSLRLPGQVVGGT
jgi:hypothetical protein